MNQYLKSNNSVFKSIIKYYLVLIPLVLYGFYKNGILLYQKDLINIFEMFKPLILPILSLGIGYLIEFIYFKNKKEDFKNLQISFLPLYSLLLTMMLPNLNYLVSILIILTINITLKLLMNFKISINKVSLIKIVLFIFLIISNLYHYENIYETNEILNYNFMDKFFGLNIGGICTTNIFFILIGFLIISIDKTYKKDIPIYIFISYFSLKIIYVILLGNINILAEALLNSNLIFGIIFIATINDSSPLKVKNQIIYGISIGTLTFIFDFITIKESVFISILILSLLNNFEQKFKKINKK